MRGGILESEARSILNVKPKASDAEVKEVPTRPRAGPRAPRRPGHPMHNAAGCRQINIHERPGQGWIGVPASQNHQRPQRAGRSAGGACRCGAGAAKARAGQERAAQE